MVKALPLVPIDNLPASQARAIVRASPKVLVALSMAGACLSACVSGPAEPPGKGAPLAIVHVNVVDVTGGPVQADHTVLVSGGRITEVARADDVHVPADARVVQGRGRWLIPGLWDMHAHISRPERDLPLLLANGITAIRDMGGEAAGNPARTPGTFSIGWNRLRSIRDDIAARRRPGPRIFAAGVMLDAPTPYPGTLGVAHADEARQIVRQLHDEQVDFIKIGSGVTRDAFAGLSDQARRMGLSVAGHVPRGMTAIEVAEAGQVSVEHLMGLPGECFADSGPDTTCTTMLRRLAATGVWSVPTLVAWRGRLLATDLEVTNRQELRYVPDLAKQWAAGASQTTAAAVESNRRTFAQFRRAVGALRIAGVRLLAGTDSANAYVVPGFALHDELGLFVEAGLTTADALAAATVSPALFFGLNDGTGTIAPGTRADFVLLEGNPLIDIGYTSRISAVVLDGELFDRAALDALLDAAAKAR